ncbi:MAG: hypothetical protein EZS28_047131, partial [Streblomastix strix]
ASHQDNGDYGLNCYGSVPLLDDVKILSERISEILPPFLDRYLDVFYYENLDVYD